MFISTLLKNRMQTFLDRMDEALKIPLAVSNGDGELIARNESYEMNAGALPKPEKLPLSDGRLILNISLNGRSEGESTAIVQLCKETLELFIEAEQESQSLSDEVLEKYEELNLVYDIIKEVAGIFDEKEISRIILKKAIEVLGIGSGAIVLKRHEQAFELIARLDNVKQFCHENLFYDLAKKAIDSNSEVLYDQLDDIPRDTICWLNDRTNWSMLSVPFQVDEDVLGAMVLVGKANGDVFRSGDVKLVDALAGYTGISIYNSRLVQRAREAEALRHEMTLARKIQQSLLPHSSPNISNLQIAGYCIPAAEVGGDFFGYFKLGANRWAIAVADVSGHGVGAALTMASLRSILRSESGTSSSPAKIVSKTNELLCEDTQDTEMYATLFFSIYDAREKTLHYTNAGHVTPWLYNANEDKWITLGEGGLAVGFFPDETYVQASVNLEKDDIIIMYTDGITEAKNTAKFMFSEEKLLKTVEANKTQSATAIAEAILNAVKKHLQESEQKDDITLVVAKSL